MENRDAPRFTQLRRQDEIAAEDHKPNYLKWARAPYWSAKQCVALVTGEDPDHIGVFLVLYHQDLHEKVLEAQRNKELPELIRPIVFLAWAREHKIDFPDELEKAVSTNEVDIAQLEERYGQLERRHDELRRDNQELRYELDRLRALQPKKPTTSKPSKKEFTSLYKLVIGMAIVKYKWDPAALRHPATRKISEDLNNAKVNDVNLGLGLDQDTVHKHLHAAKDEVIVADFRKC
jgi:cell division protein FtsB